ncbi:MAG: RNase adapter RapZ [Mycoplasmatales bacterium]
MSKKLLIISGISGSGNSTIMQELLDSDYLIISDLESIDYYATLDNLLTTVTNNKIAIFLNIQEEEQYKIKYNDVKKIKDKYQDYNIIQVFLTCKTEVLINRYNEKRKNHPFMENSAKPIDIKTAIEEEKKITRKFIKESDYVLNTTSLIPLEAQKIFNTYIKEDEEFVINLISFGFKYGMYYHTDFVFDTRFLPNPYYDKNLRNKTGLEAEVQNFVFNSQEAKELYDNIKNIIDLTIPGYKKVYKNSLTLAVACTGGKHRSVSFIQKLAQEYQNNYDVNIIHVERDRGNWDG